MRIINIGATKSGALLTGTAIAAALALAPAAHGQADQAPAPTPQAAEPQADEDSQNRDIVVITGTSIGGEAPIGSTVLVVGREDIEDTAVQTIQQLLKTVPAVVGLNSVGQGSFGSFDAAGTNAPTIRGLGASASNSTLILVNGHRIPLSGLNHTLADPNIISPAAIERVEVLADGASSVYGSDAVAGVINFITRRRYSGFEVAAQRGFGDGYDTESATALGGTAWDGGSFLASYAYSYRSNLDFADRDFTDRNHIPDGGTNLASFNCGPATIQPAGQALIFAPPYTGAGIVNTPANAMCDYSDGADLIPTELRHSVIASVEQRINDRLKLTGDLVYSVRENKQAAERGTITSTAFGPGATNASQINPFYTLPTGSTASSQTARWAAAALFPGAALIKAQVETFYAMGRADYDFNEDWSASATIVVGDDDAREQRTGFLNTSAANLALNGTTNTSGSLTTPSIPGTSTVVLNTPLTTANALDVWRPLAANRTSIDVRNRLLDSTQTVVGYQTVQDVKAQLTGALFNLPGGQVKMAVGLEHIEYTLDQDITRPNNTGPASTGSSTLNLNYERTVDAAYLELLFPLVGPEQNIPLVQSIDVNTAVRYDEYSDFGDTTNPKIGFDWRINDAVKFRANWAEAFVAPALTSRGNAQGITGESGFTTYALGPINVPVANFPVLASVPGCPATGTCTLGTTIQGVMITGGNDNLVPQTGESWSAGVDWEPSFLPGMRLSLTNWNYQLRGGITAPTPALALNSADLSYLLQIFPAGMTPAQLAAARGNLPQTGGLPTTAYFLYNFQQANILNLDYSGWDIDGRYFFDFLGGEASLGLGATYKTKADQYFGATGQVFSVLNTAGFNTTFPSLELEGRANIGWSSGGFDANLFINYTGDYLNWSGTTQIPVTRTNGVPTGGGAPVDANTTLDLNLSYDFEGPGLLGGTQVFVDVSNITDKEPPFYNSPNGYDGTNASPLGRVATIGFRKKM